MARNITAMHISPPGTVVRVMLVLLAMALMISCQGQTEHDAATIGPVIDSVASEDGVMIHYESHGTGERTLVLIHGWCGNRTFWEAQVAAFDTVYRVVTLDLGGHGESGINREKWTMELFGADVAAVVKKLELTDVILVGHSMGGRVSIEAARRLPGIVKALIGVDNFHDLAASPTEEEVRQFLEPMKADFSTFTGQFVRSLFGPNADTALVNKYAAIMAATPAAVGIGAMEQLYQYDRAAALAEVRLPIRAINSDMFPVNATGNRKIAASFGVVTMSGVGHFPHLENPSDFNMLLSMTLVEFWPKTIGR